MTSIFGRIFGKRLLGVQLLGLIIHSTTLLLPHQLVTTHGPTSIYNTAVLVVPSVPSINAQCHEGRRPTLFHVKPSMRVSGPKHKRLRYKANSHLREVVKGCRTVGQGGLKITKLLPPN